MPAIALAVGIYHAACPPLAQAMQLMGSRTLVGPGIPRRALCHLLKPNSGNAQNRMYGGSVGPIRRIWGVPPR